MLDKIKWFWSYYRHYPYVLAVLLLLTPVQAMFQVSIGRMIQFSIDYFESDKVPDHWAARLIADNGADLGLTPAASFAAALVLFGLIAGLLYAFVQSHRAWMNLKLEWLFRQDAFDKITNKGPDFFNKFRTGDLVTRMTDDVAEKLSWFACSGIFRLYEALVLITFVLVMLVSIDPQLTLWLSAPLPVLVAIFFVTASKLDKRYDRLQSRISRFNDVMEACFSGIRVVKAYVKEDAQKDVFEHALQDRRKAEIATIKTMTIIESMYHYVWQLAVIVVLVGGGYLAIQADLTVGKLGAFVYYTVYLIFPMFDIGQFLVKSRQSAVSINRLSELDQTEAMVTEAGDLATNGDTQGRIGYSNVSFGFPDSERRILDGVDFEIAPGQSIAIVGRVGSGKSWLVNMIPRLVDPTGGRVKLDQTDLQKYRLADLRRSIGFVPQEPVLFSDTARNNIIFGRENIGDDLLDWAVEVAQLKDEIATFPNGLETQIGTRGVSISGGQKQRLSLARALVGKPKILILDDCTSALDSRTETALWERLHDVMPGMTAILITHRPDTLERADMIYVLDEGQVVERGRHEDLMIAEGLYHRIYRRYRLAEQVGT